MTLFPTTLLRLCRWLALLALALGLAARPAQAACNHSACVQVSGQLASIDTKRGVLLNALFGQMLGTSVSLSVVNWQHLADTDINLLEFLQALQAELSVGTPELALDGNATIAQVLTAAATAVQAQGDTAAANALLALAVTNPPGVIRLADLLDICVQCGDFADINLNVLDLVTGSAQLFNFENLFTTPAPITISGAALGLGSNLTSIELYAQILEPPVIVCGEAGGQFYGAAIRVKLNLDLVDIALNPAALGIVLPSGATNLSVNLANVSLFLTVARASGVIQSVDAINGVVNVQAVPGIVDLYLGHIPDAVFFNRSETIDASDVDFGTVGALSVQLTLVQIFPLPTIGATVAANVRLKAAAQGQAPFNQNLVFTGPYPQTQTVNTSALFVSNLLGDLLSDLEADVQVTSPALLNILLQPILNTLLGVLEPALETASASLLSPVLAPVLTTVVDPLLEVLGIRIGEADVTVLGANLACDSSISGRVYRDENRNGIREAAEDGTGFVWFAKLVDAGAPAGPALRVVAVDPVGGAYSFPDISPGVYRIVIDDNNTLADVTPVAPPAGWTGTEFPGLVRPEVVVAGASVPNQNFGLSPFTGVAGVVFRDSGTGGGAVANDGARNGSEIGLADTELRLLGPGDVVLDTTRSLAGGAYVLAIPDTVSPGDVLRVVATPPLGRLATGATVGDTGGVYDRATGTLTFNLGAVTGYSGADFGEVPRARLLTDGQQSIMPGATALYMHRYQPGTAGDATFTLDTAANPATDGWSSLVYIDANANGQIDPGESPITAPVAVTETSDLALLVKVFAPVNAPYGAIQRSGLTAELDMANAAPALTQTHTRLDLTLIGAEGTAGLVLMKNVDKPQALPGETLTYTITYLNNASEPLLNITIRDVTPTFTQFLAAAAPSTPAQLGPVNIVAPGVGDQGDLRWEYGGTLPPAASGTITFSVTIEP